MGPGPPGRLLYGVASHLSSDRAAGNGAGRRGQRNCRRGQGPMTTGWEGKRGWPHRAS